MKFPIKLYLMICLAFISFEIKAQNTGTLIITDVPATSPINSISNQDDVARDEIDLVPTGTNGEVHLVPLFNTDQVHLHIDPTIILPTTYATGGVNTSGSSGSSGSSVVTQAIDNSLPVGATAGTYAVSNGAAMYTIPIIIPPGTNGMAPSVSIQYNSLSQSGTLGDGWSLQATSSIMRVDKNLYHDGTVQAVQLNSSDALSLDGNRLIATSTENSFVSENEIFSVITYVSGSGSSGDYYIVKTKDGKTLEYGSTANSKMQFTVSGNTVTYAWYLTKVYDNYGNTILYTYKQNPSTISGLTYNELALSEIDYTLNNNPPVSPAIAAYNSIKFDYEQRTDIKSGYVLGNLVGSTLLLRQIEVDCENAIMKKYMFTYGQNTIGESYLNKVTEYGTDNSNLNSTVIDYATAQAPAQGTGISIPAPNLPYNYKYFSGDFNGDGRSDLIGFNYSFGTFSPPFNNKIDFYTYLASTLYINNDNGLSYTQYAGVTPSSDLQDFFGPGVPEHAISTVGHINILDVNGDGMDDMVLTYSTGFTTYLSNGTGFTAQSTFVPSDATGAGYGGTTFADVNGDGLPECILSYSGDNIAQPLHGLDFRIFDLMNSANLQETANYTDINGNAYTSGAGFSQGVLHGLEPVDFDGDGKSEFIVTDDSKYYILRPIYNSSGVLQNITTIYQFNVTNQNDYVIVCDYNGDGISDYIIVPQDPNSHPTICFGTGVGVTPGSSISNAPGYGNLIFNQLGNGGVVQIGGQPNQIFSANQNQYLIGDINGDGKSDLVYFSSNITVDITNGDIDEADVQGGAINVGVSYGGGTISQITSLKQITTDHLPYCLDPTLQTTVPEFLVADFDGDGNQDILFKKQDAFDNEQTDKNGYSRWIINPYAGNANNLVKFVLDGNNNSVAFTYNTISSIDNSALPSLTGAMLSSPIYSKSTASYTYPLVKIQQPVNVVTSLTIPDGIGNTNQTTYAYQDAIAQTQGLGFLGFGKITETNYIYQSAGYTQNTQTIKACSILTSGSIIDFVPSSVTQNITNLGTGGGGSTLTNSSVYTYAIFPLTYGGTSLEHFTAITGKTTTDYTGANVVSTYVYDNNTNNITSLITNINSGYEIQTTVNTYKTYPNFTFIPSRCSTSVTTINRQTSNPSTYSRETDYDYNSQGDVIKITKDPGTQDVEVVYNYNPTGKVQSMVTSSTDANVLGVSSTLAYTYDAKYRFPATFSNALQQISQYSYDPKWGKPLSVTGVDNLTTSYKYDGYGKNIQVNTPDGLIATTNYDWVTAGDESDWTYDPIDVKSYPLLFKTTSTKQGSPTITTFYDQFGRAIKTTGDGYNNTLLNQVQVYDNLGNLYEQSNTYDNTGTYNPVLTRSSYDNLARINSVVLYDLTDNPASDPPTVNYTYGSSAGNTTITANINPAATNINDKRTIIKTYDATGLLSSTTDNASTLNYTYGGHHNPIEIDLGTSGPNTTITYDAYGRQQSLFEPNTGTTSYQYNAYGQLYTQNDASGNHLYTYTYDAMGRTAKITSQGENGGSYMYEYVPVGTNGVNQVQKVTGPNGLDQIYTYDALNRPVQSKEDVGGNIFTTNFTYDSYSNINKITYPGGFAITKSYDPHGYLNKINRADNGDVIFQTNTIDALGNFSKYTLGNNITVEKTFTDFGFASNFTANASGITNPIQNYDFVFNKLNGDLTKRTEHTYGFTESFTYDKSDRLLTAGSLVMSYNIANGNIASKSDVGNYTYDPNKVNAVTEITNTGGNPISLNTQTIVYNAFHKAQTIQEIDVNNPSNVLNELDYTYGPDQQRKQGILKDANGNTLSTTWYQNNYEKIVAGSGTNSANFTETNYIAGGDGLCAMFINDQTGIANGKLYYVFTDYLGSILKLTDENGHTVSEQSFDAWGKPRDPSDWSNAPSAAAIPGLIRGYTGHEYLPQFSLVNMNARLYDPTNARVASADNDVTYPENTQSYNRYSYCMNNPLKYTDPTGNDATNDYLLDYIGNLFNGDAAADEASVDDEADLSSVTSYTTPVDGGKNIIFLQPNVKQDPNPTPIPDLIGQLPIYALPLTGPTSDPSFEGGIISNSGGQVSGGFSNSIANFGDVAGMTVNWFAGVNNFAWQGRFFNNDRVAYALQSSEGVAQARNNFYNNGKLVGTYNFEHGFLGLGGLFNAGFNIVQQFVGSYNYTITPVGNNLQFTIKNTTSMSSAFYHLYPTSWNAGPTSPMGNQDQTYIFTETYKK